jgi:hypothetical protein
MNAKFDIKIKLNFISMDEIKKIIIKESKTIKD